MQYHIISATEASRSLSDILNKVHYQGQSFEVKRGREVIAKIIPAESHKRILKISELTTLLQNVPSLESEDSQNFVEELKVIRTKFPAEKNPWD